MDPGKFLSPVPFSCFDHIQNSLISRFQSTLKYIILCIVKYRESSVTSLCLALGLEWNSYWLDCVTVSQHKS
jgi:hypothetical protein